MKRKRKLTVILLVILNIAFYGAFFAMSYANKRSASADRSIYVSKTKLGDVASISCINSNGKFTFEKQDDSWVCTDQKDFQVNQKAVDSLAQTAVNLAAVRKVEQAGDFSQYGLDSPQFKISLTDSEGKKATYDIGKLNDNIRKYYVKSEDSADVFVIKSNYGEEIIKPLNAYSAAYDLSAIDKGSVTTIKVNDEKGSAAEITQGQRDTESPLGSDSKWKFASVFPKNTNVNSNIIDELWTDLEAAAASDCADFEIDDAKLEKYGLKQPQEIITVNYSADSQNKSFSLMVSKENADGSAYVMFGDAKVIGLASADTVKSLKAYLDAYSFLPQSVCAAKFKSLSGVTVTYNGVKYDYGITQNGTDYSVTLNGAQCDKDNFDAFFKKMVALNSNSHTSDGSTALENKDGTLVVVYHSTNASYGDLKVVISPYDSDYYVASFDGVEGRLINKRSIETVLTLLQEAK